MEIKPILFNTEMVRAILDGRKTVTRRLVNDKTIIRNDQEIAKNLRGQFELYNVTSRCGIPQNIFFKPPYQPSDILYVRETWTSDKKIYGNNVINNYYYRADGKIEFLDHSGCELDFVWRPSIHMPKEAARIWLRVKEVRVERLQECGKGWCLGIEKEGIVTPQSPILYASDEAFHEALREEFKKVWNSTIKKSDLDRYGWEANPWVWVMEFERCEKPQES